MWGDTDGEWRVPTEQPDAGSLVTGGLGDRAGGLDITVACFPFGFATQKERP